MGIGSVVMSASSPRSFTSLHGPSATIFEPPGTRVNMRSESSRTTCCGLVPSALAWRARSFTRTSQSFQPGNPRSRFSMIGRGLAEQSAPAWVIGSISSSMRIRSSPSAFRKSRRFSAIVVSSLLRLVPTSGRLQGDIVPDDQEDHLAVRGLVAPGLDGPELGDLVGLAEYPLELGALGDVPRLRDDVFLRPAAARHQTEHGHRAHKSSRHHPFAAPPRPAAGSLRDGLRRAPRYHRIQSSTRDHRLPDYGLDRALIPGISGGGSASTPPGGVSSWLKARSRNPQNGPRRRRKPQRRRRHSRTPARSSWRASTTAARSGS